MSLTLTQLASHAATVLEQGASRQALAYSWQHPWAGGESIVVAGRTLPLRYCQSSLEVRQALHEADGAPQVLLVGVPENKLGQDVLARFAGHRLLHVDRWQLVRDTYGVTQVDPRLLPMQWMPSVLLDAASARVRTSSPVLTLEGAMATALAHLFGLPTDQPGLQELALACQANHARWLVIPPDQREHFTQYLADQDPKDIVAKVKAHLKKHGFDDIDVRGGDGAWHGSRNYFDRPGLRRAVRRRSHEGTRPA